MAPKPIVIPMQIAMATIAVVNANRIRDGCTMADTAIDMTEMGVKLEHSPPHVGGERGDQILPKTRLPFVPPKPNEFLTAILIGILRAVLAQ